MKNSLPLLLILSVSLPGCSFRSEKDETFARLVRESRSEKKLCGDYESATKESRQKIDLETPFRSRGEALSALALFETRPVSFPKSDAAGAYFLAHFRDLVASRNPFSNMANAALLHEIPYHCDFMKGLLVIPKLAAAANRFRFSRAEQARVDLLARRFLGESAEAKRTDVVPLIVALIALDRYLGEARPSADLAELRKDVKDLLKDSEKERYEALRYKPGFWNELRIAYFGEMRIRETEWRVSLGARYTPLYRQAFPAPAPE